MGEEEESIFIQYVQKRKQLIKNKKILQTTYIPEQLPHRKEQINRIVAILSTALNDELPLNIIVCKTTFICLISICNLRKNIKLLQRRYFYSPPM